MPRQKPVFKTYVKGPPPPLPPASDILTSPDAQAHPGLEVTSTIMTQDLPGSQKAQKPTFKTYVQGPPPQPASRTAQIHQGTPQELPWSKHAPADVSQEEEEEEEIELNPHLQERFSNMSIRDDRAGQPPPPPQQALPIAIRKYFSDASLPVNSNSWLSRQDVPSTDEILDMEDLLKETIQIPANKIDGAWDSKEDYLESHYELLREDTIRPLREAVGRIRMKSWGKEEEYGNTVGLYSNVHIVGFTFCNRGLAARVQFSLARTGKRIHWEQSKRLLSGSLIALTPEDDGFQNRCIIATVAARPLANLVQDPPEIDIFFARPDEIEVDPGQSWLMVEERSSYFEGTRHTLGALKKLMREPFPLSEHIINVKAAVDAPDYIKAQPRIDMSAIFEGKNDMHILRPWPDDLESELDKTQVQALQRILTKKCAIVQGPPGTGKTHVSVVALKALLENMEKGFDAPIIVACQTNHALDQLLLRVAGFEPNFARLGGRSRDQDVIKKRTLFELKQADRPPPIAGGAMGPATLRLKRLERDLRSLLSPIQVGVGFFSHVLLHQLGILTQNQFDSLVRGDTCWEYHGTKQQETSSEDRIADWISKHHEFVERGIPSDDFAFEYEEIDLEFEQLKEIEAENMVKDDEDFEMLHGGFVSISENIVGKPSTNLTDEEIQRLLDKTDNMYKIKDKQRGAVYNYLRRKAKELITRAFRSTAKQYQDAVSLRTVGRWELDHMVLRKQKIIGMTTTGLSKYRALVSSLMPKIVLIEEAAETLEAPVTAACVPSLEHLILVGDHQQLRPHCHVSEHENHPFFLNMSLFERLVRNDVEYDTLRRQRRMIPEIRRLVKPIYGDLIKDHHSVKDLAIRPPVPGMGGTNTFFFTHEWPESVDAQMSSCNEKEADMIVQFYSYLFMNGVPYSNITVLTFYNGQRKLILRKLRSHPDLQGTGRDFRVVTVDSYQGEENEVVLLSLVRNNIDGRIGFLNNMNRVCVALSRAKRGFYMFGNGELLASESKIWAEVITILAGKKSTIQEPMRIGYHLPLACTTHGRKSFIEDPNDWEVHGGCEEKCKGRLPCGHFCMLSCHPFPHETVRCMQKCQRTMGCGHVCATTCDEECRCARCPQAGSGAILRPGARPTLETGKVALRANDTAVSSRMPPMLAPIACPQPFAQASSSQIGAHRKSNSTESDPATWKAYTKNVHRHDAELTQVANQKYQEMLKQFDQHRNAQAMEDMERSVFDNGYRSGDHSGDHSGSSTAVATADGRSSSTASGAISALDGHGPRRQRWVEDWVPSSGSRTPISEPSLLD